MYSRFKYMQSGWLMHSDSIIRTRMKKSAIPVRVSAWLEIWNRTTQRQERMEKNRRSKKKRHLCLRREPFVGNRRSTRKEKTSPQRFIFVNNCIVFKVQEFMYKNTVVLASAPQRERKRENRRKAQTLGRRVREQKQNTEQRKWIYREKTTRAWKRAIQSRDRLLLHQSSGSQSESNFPSPGF